MKLAITMKIAVNEGTEWPDCRRKENGLYSQALWRRLLLRVDRVIAGRQNDSSDGKSKTKQSALGLNFTNFPDQIAGQLVEWTEPG